MSSQTTNDIEGSITHSLHPQPFEAVFAFVKQITSFLEKLITWPRDCGQGTLLAYRLAGFYVGRLRSSSSSIHTSLTSLTTAIMNCSNKFPAPM